MSRNTVFAAGEFFHLYNRGTEKRNIFLDSADYERFSALLYMANSAQPIDLKQQGRTLFEVQDIDRGETLVNICGYVLMPNHFHLLVEQTTEGGISIFMRKLGTAYTMYFNAKNERSGALFQGKFKAKHIDEDIYLQHLLSYIHLNPVKLIEPDWRESGIADRAVAEKYLSSYRHSSFIDYMEVVRPENCILNKSVFPTELVQPSDFKETVTSWLQGPTL